MVDITLCIMIAVSSASIVSISYFYKLKRREALLEIRKEMDDKFQEVLSRREGCVIEWEEEIEEEEEILQSWE